MTDANTLLWHQAIDDGDWELARQLEAAQKAQAMLAAPAIEATAETAGEPDN